MKIVPRDARTLEVVGVTDLTATNAAQVRDEIRGALQTTTQTLDLDLSGVGFLDSSGLGALISLHKALRSQGGAVRLINPAPNVRQILELTRLHRVFELIQR